MRGVRSDLQRLDKLDRWFVVNYWRALLWKQRFDGMPLAGRLSLLTSLFALSALATMPRADQLPAIFLPLLWMGAYTFSLSVCMLLPRRRRQIFHWVR